MIINGEGAILGRLASIVAKKILMGEEVIVVNVEKVVVSGDPKKSADYFLEKRQRGSFDKGPYYPRHPDRIFRRVVRGMVPYKKTRGKTALKKLKVYVGCPADYKNLERIGKNVEELRSKYTTLGEISRRLGAYG
jgi:large subunit ribosomal protein L13